MSWVLIVVHVWPAHHSFQLIVCTDYFRSKFPTILCGMRRSTIWVKLPVPPMNLRLSLTSTEAKALMRLGLYLFIFCSFYTVLTFGWTSLHSVCRRKSSCFSRDWNTSLCENLKNGRYVVLLCFFIFPCYNWCTHSLAEFPFHMVYYFHTCLVLLLCM